MFIDGYVLYTVKVITQDSNSSRKNVFELKKNKSKYALHDYFLVCRNYDTGKEVDRILLISCKSYNDMDNYMTVQRSKTHPLVFVSTGMKSEQVNIDIFHFDGKKLDKIYTLKNPGFHYQDVGAMMLTHRNFLIVELYKSGISSNYGLYRPVEEMSEYMENKMLQGELLENGEDSIVDLLVFKIDLVNRESDC